MLADRTRREAVYALGGSMLDWIPSVRVSTPGGLRAEAPSELVECSACQGWGRRRVRGVVVSCDRCSGSGRRAVDGYTGREVRVADVVDEGPREAEERRRREALRRDSELKRLARMELVRADEEASDWWMSFALREQERLFSRGSYRELVDALRWLEPRAPRSHRRFVQVVVVGEPYVVTGRLRAVLDSAADVLAGCMPDPIRVPAEYDPARRARVSRDALARGRQPVHVEARRTRDEGFRIAAELGASTAGLAEVAGLSERHVRRLIQGTCSPAGSEACA